MQNAAPLLSRAERIRWTRVRDEYEELARATTPDGRLVVVDWTEGPVPPRILRELSKLDDPRWRDAKLREAAALRRKAKSMTSLAELAKPEDAERMRGRADAFEAEAHAIERLTDPLN